MRKVLVFLFLFCTALFSNEKVVLQLKWLHQFQFAGYYAALEKGFYKDEGLDVVINQRDLTKNNIEQVINNEAQYGVSDSILLLYRAQKKPVVIVTPIFQHSPGVILTRKDSGIDSPYKLGEKKLVFYEKDTDGFGILAMLQSLHVNPEILRIKKKTNYEALIDGKVDAYSAYLTNEPFYFKEKGIELNIINPANYGADLYGDMLFTNEYEVKNYPTRVEKFKKATLKGWEYALTHKEEIIKLIHEKYAQNKSIEHLRFEADGIEQMIQSKSIPLGTLDKGRMEYAIQKYSEFGLLDKNIPLRDYIFETYKDLKRDLDLTKQELEYIHTKGIVNVCIDPNWMPFEKLEDGKHIGLSADYLSFISKKYQIPFHLVTTKSWEESVSFAKERKCDLLAMLMETNERRKYFNFTHAYFEEPLVLATSINELFIDNFARLRDKKIGIVKGYAILDTFSKKYPNIEFITIENLESGLKLIQDGKIFGVVDSLTTLGYLIQKEFLGQIKIATKLEERWKLSMGARSDEPLLADILDKALYSINDTDKQKILNNWVSVIYQENRNYDSFLKWLAGVGVVILFIIIGISIVNRRLAREIKSRHITEQKLTRYIDLVDRHIIISSTDLNGNITEVSEAFCEVSGYTKEELIGNAHSIVRCPLIPIDFYEQMWKELTKRGYWEGEFKNKSKQGKIFWLDAHISAIYDHKGEKIGYTSIVENITDKKLLEEISITDELTKLYNRRYFNEMFPKAINSAKRNNELIGFAILDIDYFKLYNDTYGHLGGDSVLISVANSINNSLNRADDLSFRLGGEEFGILFRGRDKEKSIEFIESIRANIENLHIKHVSSVVSEYVTISVGLVILDSSVVNSIEKLYKQADELLYKAKANGRNQVQNN